MFKRALYLCLFTLSGLGLAAHADTIGPTCASCFGSSYTLSYTSTGTPDVYDVDLTINATGFTKSNTDLLNSVSLKLASQSSDITQVTLISAPATFSTVGLSGLGANGCGTGGGGSFCTESTTNGLQVGHAGDIYDFDFQVTLASSSDLLTGLDAASFKALYVTAGDQQDGITSENITLDPGSTSPVPEPGALSLLGTGLAGMALIPRRMMSRLQRMK